MRQKMKSKNFHSGSSASAIEIVMLANVITSVSPPSYVRSKVFTSRFMLELAIDAYLAGEPDSMDIATWDVSRITDMSGLLKYQSETP